MRKWKGIESYHDTRLITGWKCFLKNRRDTKDEIISLITKLKTFTGCKVRIIQFDGGGEFLDFNLCDWFNSKGITLEISAPDTQQQNRVAKQYNCTTHEHAVAMLKDIGILDSFWPEAHEYSNYVHNHTPTVALKHTTPYEVFHGRKPNVATLHIFGLQCHIHIPKEKWGKLDAHSIDGIFYSFTSRSKAYKVWIPAKHKFITSRDVIVYEKIPEHEDDPIITSTPSEGVSPYNGAPSEGNIKPSTPITEKPASAPACEPSPEPTPEPQPTPPLPTVTPVITSNPEPKAQPTQPHCSECATHPSWRKIASDSQKATNMRWKADNKAHAEQPMLNPPSELSKPHSHPPDHNMPTNEAEMVNLTYLATHGPITLLNYKEAI